MAGGDDDAAQLMRERLRDGLPALGRSPGIGHYHDEWFSRKYRIWNLYPDVVVYAWEASPIRIVSIVHGAGDLATILTLREEID